MAYVRENKDKLQKLLQRIGNVAYSMTSEDWTKIVIGYFLEGPEKITHLQIQMASFSQDYVDIQAKAWECSDYDDAILVLGDLCRELHLLCAAAGDDWTSMTYGLTRDGSFNVDYSYDTIDDYDGEFILDWQSRYLD